MDFQIRKLGIIAPEFPPSAGGMQTVALGLARVLSARTDLFVVTRTLNRLAGEPYQVHSSLTGDLDEDAEILSSFAPDTWLLMNAGYAPVARCLSAPSFAYCHGRDFLKPWYRRAKYRPAQRGWLAHPFLRGPLGIYRRFGVYRDLQLGMKSIRHFFANSRATASLLARKLQLEAAAITVVAPGVDDDFFQPRVKQVDGPFKLLVVSRLMRSTRRKNVDGVIRAISQIDDIPIHLTVVGDGDDRVALQQLAIKLAVESRVSFVGTADRQSLLMYYRESDLLILVPKPTRTDVEGFGIVYVEAAASGLPVLGANSGGCLDAIESGVTGELLDASSPAAIAAGIRSMWSNRVKYKPESMQQFAKQFLWENVGEKLYVELLKALKSHVGEEK